MSANTKIEWCDHTFNPWIGCQKVGPGCDHCYAEAWDRRFAVSGHAMRWGAHAKRTRTSQANWKLPLKWNAKPFCECMDCHWRGDARDAELKTDVPGTEFGSGAWRVCPNCKQPTLKEARQRVFCASLADVFDTQVDEQWRADLFALIRATPNIDWLLLTKRIGNAQAMLDRAAWLTCRDRTEPTEWEPLPNVWLGATVVNQEEADRDIPKLLAVPAAKRFLSMEPLLGPVHLDQFHPTREPALPPLLDGVDWVIVGGESGPGARPMHPDWARSLRDQCAVAGVPFLFKQWGEWLPINQQEEEFTNSFYRSNRIAEAHENQDNLDDCYGRRCTVATTVVHMDGSTHGVTESMAFMQGTGAMTTFKAGKKAAGRLLDGIEHNGFPS